MYFPYFIALLKVILPPTKPLKNKPCSHHTMQHKQKSRTFAQKQVRTPASRVVTHYKKRKPKPRGSRTRQGRQGRQPRGKGEGAQPQGNRRKRN